MNPQAEQMILKAQQERSHSAASRSPESVAQVIELILSCRTLCRPFQGAALTSVQQSLLEQLRQELKQCLPTALNRYNRGFDVPRVWMIELLKQSWRLILTDDGLKQLALEIQQQPVDAPLRRHLLGELVEAIRLSGKLCRPHREKFSPEFYELLYDEAVTRTLAYICKGIHLYDPQRGQSQKFMNWVNFRLDRTLLDCRREFGQSEEESIPSLADLESLSQPEPDTLFEQTREYIATDPEGSFCKEHIRNHPEVTFQAIALARFDGKSWEEISQQFGVKIPTLSSFFQRCCSKYRPQFLSLTESS